MKKLFLFIASAIICISGVLAQESEAFKPTMKMSGFTQAWYSYSTSSTLEDAQNGFNLRRVRLAASGNVAENVKYKLQLGMDQLGLSLLNAQITYAYSKAINITGGKFIVPGAKTGGLTTEHYSSLDLPLMQRPQTAMYWGSASGSVGYRDVGVLINGNLADGFFRYHIVLANPNAAKLFSPSNKNSENSSAESGLKTLVRAEIFPVEGMNIGVFGGTGRGDVNPNIDKKDTYNMYDSYGANFSYNANDIFTMIEYIAGTTNTTATPVDYNGIDIEFGYWVTKQLMPAVRYEIFEPGMGIYKKYNNISLGLSYVVTKKLKLQAAGVFRTKDYSVGSGSDDDQLFQVGVQYVFAQ